MEKKAISVIMLTLLFTSMLTLAFNIPPAKAWTGTVYIRADGSIDPSDAPIITFDNIAYALTDNITGTALGIVVERNNIVIDGAGYTVQGTESGTGIRLEGMRNVTIKNTNIKYFYYGIRLSLNLAYYSPCRNNNISGNNITNNEVGIWLSDTRNSNISGNNITNNQYGIRLSYIWYPSRYNIISRNSITNNLYGVYNYGGSDNTFYHNNFVDNARAQVYFSEADYANIWDDGYPSGGNYWSDYTGNDIYSGPYQNEAGSDGIGDTPYVIDANNQDRYPLMNSYAPVYAVIYIREDGSVDPPTAPILNVGNVYYTFTADINGSIIIERDNIVVDGNGYTLQGDRTGVGLRWESRQNVTVKKTTITNFSVGIYVSSVHAVFYGGNTISDNTITNNSYGIEIVGFISLDNNTISDNTLINNNCGIYLHDSDGNILSNNNVINGFSGIYLLTGVDSNTISGNNVTNNSIGIILTESSNNTISGNNIAKNAIHGISLYDSDNNTIFHNNFINNTQQVHDESWKYPSISPSINVWDDGYPSGGNYWSDYRERYPDAQELDGSGIWDTPYVIDADNQDNYPLMNPWTPIPPPEEWSFAIITDLHIGRGYPDYGGEGFDDMGTTGQDYYLTERLEKVVEWMNGNHENENIKFLVVLGDIADSGEYSELDKAKKILDGLEIPYFPVIGNHDVWSKTDNGEEVPVADFYFSTIFNKTFFSRQFKELGVTGKVQEHPFLLNYAFSYNKINFIGLDFVNRETPIIPAGTAKAILHEKTEEWLNKSLSEGGSTILLSHHPMIEKEFLGVYDYCFDIDDIIRIEESIIWAKYNFGTRVLANFAGHIHGYYDEYHPLGFSPPINPHFMDANVDYREEGYFTPAGIPVVTTEAMMVASNEDTPKAIIRIVKVKGEDYSPIDGEFRALNPHFHALVYPIKDHPLLYAIQGKVCVDFEAYAFNRRFNETRPLNYDLFLDDVLVESISSTIEWPVKFTNGGKHYRLKPNTTYKVTLRVQAYTPEGEPIMENITKSITIPAPKVFVVEVFSPVGIAVTDPEGRTISKQDNEIPEAAYIEFDLNGDGDLDDLVLIPDPLDGNYTVLLIGTATGTYSLNTELIALQETTFVAVDIPISANAFHQYTIDWNALSPGEEGVTVKVDSDGDGVFELTFTSDNELTRDEFMQQVPPAEAFPMWIVGVAIAMVAVTTVAVAVFWRRRKQPPTKG